MNDSAPYVPNPTPFAKPIFSIPATSLSSVLTVIFFLIFVVWAIYTVIVAYHWFRYGHRSWLAIPAIVTHLVVSGFIILLMASGI